MSANIKCYDQATGNVAFDMQTHTTRVLGIIGGNSTSGTITASVGGGKLFWTLASGGAWAYSNEGAAGGFIFTKKTNSEIKISSISDSTFTYEKPEGFVIIYGVYV